MNRESMAGMKRPAKTRPPGLWRWHLWAGLGAMGLLLIASVSGALLIYQKELIALVVTPGAELPPAYDSRQLAQELEVIVSDRYAQSLLNLKAPSELEPYWTIRHEDGLELLALNSLEPYRERLWFLRTIELIRELHVDLLSGVWGEALLLVSGLLSLFLCVSGVILWWPGRRGFRWRWVFPRNIRPSQWLQYHRHCGALASPLLLLVLFTGSIMLWQKLVRPLLPPLANTQMAATEQARTSNIAARYLITQAQVPDAWPTYIRIWPQQGSDWMKVRFRLAGEWHLNGRTAVEIDINTGAMLMSPRSDQVTTSRRLVNQLYPLHSGFGMNGVYRGLMLLVGVALGWLAWTGGVHYMKRYRQRRRRRA